MYDQTDLQLASHDPVAACLPFSPHAEITLHVESDAIGDTGRTAAPTLTAPSGDSQPERLRRDRSAIWIAGMLTLAAVLLITPWALRIYHCRVLDRPPASSLGMNMAAPSWVSKSLARYWQFAFGSPNRALIELTQEFDSRADVQRVMWCLSELNSLKVVSLFGDGVTDADMVRLRTLNNLESLNLIDMHISAAGLDILDNLPKLERLTLYGSGFDDAALVPVSRIVQLKSLSLGRVSVTDTGLNQITSLKHLERLSLDRTAVTDAGLFELRGLTCLKHLSVRETQITDAGIDALRAALPGLEVTDD